MDDIIEEVKQHFNINFDLKEEQLQCLQALVEWSDVLGILPTGYGKSLIFQMAPFIISLSKGIPNSSSTYFALFPVWTTQW